MERLPRRTPSSQNDIVGLVGDAIVKKVEEIPIIGGFVASIASLFGGAKVTNSRVLRLEKALSQGASGFDDFNRGNSESSLGKHPDMPAPWIQGGNGEVLGIRDRAANVKTFLTPAAGRRWAKYPKAASQDKHSFSLVCAGRANGANAGTTLLWAANSDLTEFIYAHLVNAGGVLLGRGTRSGNTWSFGTPWKTSPYRVGESETIEGQSDGAGTYQVIVDGDPILTHPDTSGYPIDVNHRWAGFAIQTWTGVFLQAPEYGWGVEAVSLRSETEVYTAIETAVGVAEGAATTAGNAEAAAGAVLGIAENADAKATQAQDTANAALDSVQDALNGAQQTGKEFMPASAGVVLGRNEINIGPSVVVPPGRDFRATSVLYGLEQNTGGIAIELLKISPTRAATVMHTANIPANQLEYQATGLNIPVPNGYRYACNVIGLVGQASVLVCSVDGALL